MLYEDAKCTYARLIPLRLFVELYTWKVNIIAIIMHGRNNSETTMWMDERMIMLYCKHQRL